MRVNSKVLSMILAITMIFSVTVNNSFAEGSNLEKLINTGKSMIGSFLNSFSGDKSLSDINSHWAKDYIERMVNAGVITGYTNGTFLPDNTMTRAEFIKTLLSSMSINPGVSNTGHWSDNYIKSAVEQKILLAEEKGDPDRKISKMELTKMVVRAMKKDDLAKSISNQNTSFKDNDSITPQNRGYAIVAKAYGIIAGYNDGTYRPNNCATRAEAVKIICTYLDNKNKNIDLTQNGNDLIIGGNKVTSSHPELIPHIKKAMEIMSTGGYAEFKYYPNYKHVYFDFYKTKEDSLSPKWIKKPILLDCSVYTEKDSRNDEYYPYHVSIYDVNNEMARNMFIKIIEDTFPEAQSYVLERINKKLSNSTFNEDFCKIINGRTLTIFTYGDSKQIYAFY